MSQVLSSKQYIQSLPRYITLCERNYLRALKVLPEEVVGEQRVVDLSAARYSITIENVSKYTTDVSIEQLAAVSTHLLISPCWSGYITMPKWQKSSIVIITVGSSLLMATPTPICIKKMKSTS